MSDENDGEEQTFVKQLAESRKQAIESVHAVRAEKMNRASANLIREASTPHIVAEATQYVCDYLQNLRTYSHQSDNWDTGIGIVQLAKTIPGSSPGLKRGSSGVYRCTQMPYLKITDMGAAIRAGNTNIIYARSSSQSQRMGGRSNQLLYRVQGRDLTAKGLKQYQNGEALADCDTAGGLDTEFEPASRSEDEQHYKFVYTADQLLALLQIGDNVASEAGKLGDIGEQPDGDTEGF